MINKITFYDKDLVDLIINDFKFLKKNIKLEKYFWGYKLDNTKKYFSFFFSLYKKSYLLFTFRTNQNEENKKRIYVNYENIGIIKYIIEKILSNEEIEDVYSDYLFEVTDVDELLEAKNCHLKLDGLEIIEEPNGISLDEIEMPLRLKKALYRYDILTLKQFLNIDIKYLEKMKYFGKKTYIDALKLKYEYMKTEELKEEIEECSKHYIKEGNQGKKWEIQEDQQLIEEFVMGKSMKDISIIHERTRGAIRRRLSHLNLIEGSTKK